jgi:hypothetical protein
VLVGRDDLLALASRRLTEPAAGDRSLSPTTDNFEIAAEERR